MNSQELYDLRNREMENDRHYNRDYGKKKILKKN